jgi:NAD(P)H-hydrate epimerase
MQPDTVVTVADVPELPPRPRDAHKGSFGTVVVVAGSRGMTGAAILCASAALRGGAGLVRLGVPESAQPIVAAANPCYTTAGLPQGPDGQVAAAARDPLLALVRGGTVAVLGPGLGHNADLAGLLIAVIDQTTLPLVLDADALNALAPHTDRLAGRSAPLVLTPHPGELGRLINRPTAAVQADREGLAVRFAAQHRLVLVLKGAGTIVTDGRRLYVNRTGNPGMATGGTGDVLAGLIAALLAQGLDSFAAARLGVYLHGLSGDLARDEIGEASLIATDLLDYLPRAFRAHAASRA